MLTRILVDNYRALVNFEFRPGKLCLLLGDNGSGKSSLFEALACVSDVVVRGRPVVELFQGSQTIWDAREVQRFELDVKGPEGTFRYALGIRHAPNRAQPPVIESESITLEGQALYQFADGEVHLQGDGGRPPADFPFQGNQSFLANLDPRSYRLGWFKSFMAGIRILQPNPFAAKSATEEEFPILDRNCTNIPAYFYYLNGERPEARSALETRLRQIMPGFLNFKLQRLGKERLFFAAFNNEGIPTFPAATGAQGAQGPQSSQRQQPFDFGLLQLSEGQRVLIALYSALYGMVEPNSVLCFDEPDNFLSLPEVQPWLQELRDSLERRGGQAMVISHHPEVIDYLALDSAWRFERPAGAVVARQLDFGSSPDLSPSQIIARGG